MIKRLIFLCALTLCFQPFNLSAQSKDDQSGIAEPLRPWVGWVEARDRQAACSRILEVPHCIWPGRLSLDLEQGGGSFELRVAVEKQEKVALPGNPGAWPIDVKVLPGAAVLPVTDHNGTPAMLLEPGDYTVSGRFVWQEIPEYLQIPAKVATFDLTINKARIEAPRLKNGNQLWLGAYLSDVRRADDMLLIKVFRKLQDGLPFLVLSRFELDVRGRQRQIDLGDLSFNGARLVDVGTTLTKYFDDRGHLQIEAAPGAHVVEALSLFPVPPAELLFNRGALKEWPLEEVWVWAGDAEYRTVSLNGGTPIESVTAGVPAEWRNLPGFLMQGKDALRIEQAAAVSRPARPALIALERNLYLGFNGEKLRGADHLTATLGGQSRLNMGAGTALKYVELEGTPQLITRDPAGGLSGVEVRSEKIDLRGETEVAGVFSPFNAIGWNHGVDWLRISLTTPPGWELWGALGADSVVGARSSAWSLQTIFVLLVIAGLTAKVLGLGWGLLALITFSLLHGDDSGLAEIFFVLLLWLAWFKSDPALIKNRLLVTAFLAISLYFGYALLRYVSVQTLSTVYPVWQSRVTDAPHFTPSVRKAVSAPSSEINYNDARIADSVETVFSYAEGSFGALVMVLAGLSALVALMAGRLKVAAGLFAIAVASFLVRSTISTFFNVESLSVEEAYEELAKERGLPSAAPQRPTQQVQAPAPSEGAAQKQAPGQLVIQTGSGVPQWTWRSAILSWEGGVPAGHSIRLLLLPPLMTGLVSLIKIVLLLLLGKALWRHSPAGLAEVAALGGMRWQWGGVKKAAPGMLALALLSGTTVARAEPVQSAFPSQQLLQELQERLDAGKCQENCIATESLTFAVSGFQVQISATVHSLGRNSWPIPGPVEQFSPEHVKIDGQENFAAQKYDTGMVWVRVPHGVHKVEVSGKLISADTVSLRIEENPGTLRLETAEWSGYKTVKDGAAILRLVKKTPGVASVDATRSAAPVAALHAGRSNWFKARRKLRLGIDWTAETIVQRLGSSEEPAVLRLPLLDGEAVAPGQVQVEEKTAVLSFGPGAGAFSWHSRLTQDKPLALAMPADAQWSEEWEVECSTIWECNFSGLAGQPEFAEGNAVFRFRPAPGDKLAVEPVKPVGVPGVTKTVLAAKLNVAPGTRQAINSVTFLIRASSAGVQNIALPEGASVRKALIDREDAAFQLRQSGNSFDIPLRLGTHTYTVEWQAPWSNRLVTRLPRVLFAGAASNATVTFVPPKDRYIVEILGPRYGARATIVAVVLVAMLTAILFKLTFNVPLPLWALLAFAAGVPALRFAPWRGLLFCAVVFAVLWALLQKAEFVDWLKAGDTRLTAFKGAVLIITAFVLMALFQSTTATFDGGPSSAMIGPDSAARLLTWYADQIEAAFPTVVIVSLPRWLWQFPLLIWALLAAGVLVACLRRFYPLVRGDKA